MMMSRVLAIVGVIALVSCTESGPAGSGPAPIAVPAFGAAATDTPNSLPDSYTNGNPMNDETGVVGVRHLPP